MARWCVAVAAMLACGGCSMFGDAGAVPAGVAARERGADAAKLVPPEVRSPSELIDEARLMATLRTLPTKRAARGDGAHRRGLRETEELILARVREAGLAPTIHELPIGDGKDTKGGDASADAGVAWRNVLVDLPGTDSAGEVVLLGAHFDAVPGSPGADDNGSGTAALLEIARAYGSMRARGWRTHKTIRLAFFNLEEVGMVGSTRYFRDFARKNAPDKEGEGPSSKDSNERAGRERVVAMASLEMLGYYSDAANSQRSPFPKIEGVFDPPTVGDSIVIVALAKHRELARSLERGMLENAPGIKVFVADFSPLPLPDLMRSDHAAFALAGVPAAMITDTANFRNPNYHKASDTLEAIDAPRFTRTARGIAGAWWTLAGPIAPGAGDSAGTPKR